jgi:hypothetical protein
MNIQELLRVSPEVKKNNHLSSTEELLIKRNPALGSYNSSITIKMKMKQKLVKPS